MLIYREQEGVVDVTMTANEFDSSELPLKGWTRDVSLQLRQDLMWNKIKAHRDYLSQNGGYKVGAKWYHSDLMSRTQQIALVVLGAGIPAGLQWKTMDGSFVTMTPTLAQQIFGAGALSDTSIFATAEHHHAEMLGLAKPEDYDFSSGWPQTYIDVKGA